jgi:hypothetical protein
VNLLQNRLKKVEESFDAIERISYNPSGKHYSPLAGVKG